MAIPWQLIPVGAAKRQRPSLSTGSASTAGVRPVRRPVAENRSRDSRARKWRRQDCPGPQRKGVLLSPRFAMLTAGGSSTPGMERARERYGMCTCGWSGSGRTQMLRKLIGSLGSPCAWSLIGSGPCALYAGLPM